ncbi:hypothetical protein PRZ48_005993 [Zasmidium cellare]|uniref:Uncharacterized protein n=1 Tax=Zasmidium cellare TaxID=395010 RepID=A0ABR0EM60_ZASCE|nr:hypothetical protein PRZ48_005993 [Zasmidium cellare]
MSVQAIIDRFEAVHPLQKPAPIYKMGGKISGKDAKQTSAGPQTQYTVQVIQHADNSGSGTFTNEPSSESDRKATETSDSASTNESRAESSSYTTQVIQHTDGSGSGTLTNELSTNTGAEEATASNKIAKIEEDPAPGYTPDATVQVTSNPTPAIETLDLIAIINIMRKGDLFSGGNNLPHEVVYRGTAPQAIDTGDLSVKKICEDRRCRVHFRPTGKRRQVPVPLVKRR